MKEFKTESRRILDLVINSIYSNREVFLRELISNASDALDKAALAQGGAADRAGEAAVDGRTPAPARISGWEPEITLAFDAQARTITVSDNGIGMTADELERELGTIARSSSLDAKQIERARQADREPQPDSGSRAGQVDIIGQFGVGFYASFMVADQVRVVSRALHADEAAEWVSDGVSGFDVIPAVRPSHGTDVILHLRRDDDAYEYSRLLSRPALEDLVVRYSNYIRYPICMEVHGRRLGEGDARGNSRRADGAVEDYTEKVTLNSMVPVWAKAAGEVSLAEYDEFYKREFGDTQPPLKVISMHARGSRSCDVLLFIPKEPPLDLYSPEYKKGLELYSSGVLIQERCSPLIQEYFGFVRGVVDSPDIELNLSRESLQEDEFLAAVAQQIDRRLLWEMEAMRDNERRAYVDFFGSYGRIFKFALYATFGALNEKLEDLLLFFTANREEPVTLKEYVEAMPDGQPCIFFASGDESARLEASPSVMAALDAGFDVLLCDESIDELAMMTLRSYAGLPIKNVSSGDVRFGEDDGERLGRANAENRRLLEELARILPDDVVGVRLVSHLKSVPACVVASGAVSLGLEKYFAALPDEVPGKMRPEHVLELNIDHPITEKLMRFHAAGDDAAVCRYAIVLHGQALLAEGLALPDRAAYSRAVYELM